MRTLTPSLLLAFLAAPAAAQERLPILDVHLHAVPADHLGSPPVTICTPMPFPAWDPSRPYGEMFGALAKTPPCPDPVWSPMTDEELMNQTIEAMNRSNIVGVLSGPEPERVAAWTAAAPERFIPGLVLEFGSAGAGFSTDFLRGLHAAGRLAVLEEVVNQYAGIAPDDERMEPHGSRPVDGDGEGQGAPVTWVREDVESTNRRSPMVMTVLEARVAPERWEALRASYAQRARLSEEGPVLESFLVQADDDPDTWRIVTVWRDRESLEAMRASGETPTGVLIFRDADAEPRLSIFTVFANPRAAAGSIP